MKMIQALSFHHKFWVPRYVGIRFPLLEYALRYQFLWVEWDVFCLWAIPSYFMSTFSCSSSWIRALYRSSSNILASKWIPYSYRSRVLNRFYGFLLELGRLCLYQFKLSLVGYFCIISDCQAFQIVIEWYLDRLWSKEVGMPSLIKGARASGNWTFESSL